jgi:hypothetical protein
MPDQIMPAQNVPVGWLNMQQQPLPLPPQQQQQQCRCSSLMSLTIGLLR